MRLLTSAALVFFAAPVLGDQCEDLAKEYTRYDGGRLRFEVSGIQNDSAFQADNRLTALQIILEKQAIAVELIIASDFALPAPPRPFSETGIMCQGSPQACRD